MTADNARRLAEEDQHDCPVCDAEDPYVLYDNDKMCGECGHTPSAGGMASDDAGDEWDEWFNHRDEYYSGFYGPDRIKFPGGFARAYFAG